MESLRERDPASRSLRRKMREMSRAHTRLSAELGRAPLPEEMAQAMGMSLAAFQTFLQQVRSTDVVSLEESLETDPQVEARAALAQEPAAAESTDPVAALEHKQFLQMVSEGVERLPEREQIILALYYGQEMTLSRRLEASSASRSRGSASSTPKPSAA